jgi:hypothetical protein
LHQNDVLGLLWERNTLHSVNVHIQELIGWKLLKLSILLSIGIELIEDLIFLSDQLHVLPLQVVLLVGKYDVETRLLLHLIILI